MQESTREHKSAQESTRERKRVQESARERKRVQENATLKGVFRREPGFYENCFPSQSTCGACACSSLWLRIGAFGLELINF